MERASSHDSLSGFFDTLAHGNLKLGVHEADHQNPSDDFGR